MTLTLLPWPPLDYSDDYSLHCFPPSSILSQPIRFHIHTYGSHGVSCLENKKKRMTSLSSVALCSLVTPRLPHASQKTTSIPLSWACFAQSRSSSPLLPRLSVSRIVQPFPGRLQEAFLPLSFGIKWVAKPLHPYFRALGDCVNDVLSVDHNKQPVAQRG